MGSGPEFDTLVDIFRHSVQKFASSQLFGTKRDGVWSWTTYAEFGRAVERARAGLASLGVQRGDCVAMVSNNRVERAVTAYGCYGLGAVFVPMYEAQSVGEWRFIASDCEAKILVVAGRPNLEKARPLLDAIPSLKRIVAIVPEDASNGLADGGDDARVGTFAALLGADARPSESIQPLPDDLATLIYTSGTTGNPKGVMLSHRNIASNVNAIHHVLELSQQDRSLAFLPWAHVFGQTAELHHLLSAGASMALCEGPDKIIENLAEVRPTILFSVPRIFNRLYTAVQQQVASKPKAVQKLVAAALRTAAKIRGGQKPGLGERAVLAIADKLVFSKVRARLGGRLRYASSGGAALSREVAEFIDAIGITVYEGYGLTETSPVVSTNYPGVRKIGTVGPAVPGVRIAIDAEAAPGTDSTSPLVEGEIVVYGPNVMKGYYKRPDETAAAFTSDGGFRTGDLGCVDERGFLSITGRIKEQYKLENGKYVLPASLEEQLKLSPYIANALVYGDNRPFNVALVVANGAAVRAWAADQHLTVPSEIDALLADERIRALFRAEIAKQATHFKGFEAIREFQLLSDDFTTDNGLLTPKLSLRRRSVIERYKDAIERLYSVKTPSAGASASAA